MAVDYAALKKGGFMRQKQKNNFSLRLQVVGGNLTAKNLAKTPDEFFIFFPRDWHIAKVANDTDNQDIRVLVIKVDYKD